MQGQRSSPKSDTSCAVMTLNIKTTNFQF
uniref:Uncharacterized protein n=1 Tax=Rhizophora mucronata TaxID=61149 RepID=A0A2P2KR65_RHIMU